MSIVYPKDHVSSPSLDSREVKQNGDAPSAEDLAWADSCLAINSLSESGWGSLRDALLETLDPYADSIKPDEHDYPKGTDTEMIKLSKLKKNGVKFSDGDDTEMISSSKESEISMNVDKDLDNVASSNNDNNFIAENGDMFGPGFTLENVFLATYNESHINIGFSDKEYESALPAFKIDDQSPKDIFKIWELGSSFEDEELITEFSKAISEKPLESLPAVSDVSEASDGLRELDDLISGIADLSLVEGAV
ncbi:hypothetical protein LIER_36638 [Lithospermum erythrorhizon]|uniref:Uncharacterized protein n=1 Tax=Lithospermum erythrorhizon TaxID=34254 RepID=A0AAV3PAF2_LITER